MQREDGQTDLRVCPQCPLLVGGSLPRALFLQMCPDICRKAIRNLGQLLQDMSQN